MPVGPRCRGTGDGVETSTDPLLESKLKRMPTTVDVRVKSLVAEKWPTHPQLVDDSPDQAGSNIGSPVRRLRAQVPSPHVRFTHRVPSLLFLSAWRHPIPPPSTSTPATVTVANDTDLARAHRLPKV